MKKGLGLMAILVAPILLLIAGCGSGEGGAGTAAVVVSTVSGVAAAGVPLNGTVKLKDSSSPANELSDTIAADGSFSFNVDGLKPPFILKAQGTAGGTNYYLYSFSAGPGIANINPFTKLAVANAAGRADLATLYSAPPAATMQTIAANLAKAIADIQNKLQPLLDSYNTTSYSATANPVSGLYAANHLGLD
ncbi:MAG: cytochrome c, partial [Geobacteraceae bacterium]|nr:cytochrome c [Geobacteraceae bacterium]